MFDPLNTGQVGGRARHGAIAWIVLLLAIVVAAALALVALARRRV